MTPTKSETKTERKSRGRRYYVMAVVETWKESEFNGSVLRVSVETVTGERLSLGFSAGSRAAMLGALGA